MRRPNRLKKRSDQIGCYQLQVRRIPARRVVFVDHQRAHALQDFTVFEATPDHRSFQSQ